MHMNGIPPDQVEKAAPDPEVTPAVPAKPKRRQFTLRFKLRTLEETDRLSDGEVGAYLRKNGLYWSYLSCWRRQRDAGALAESGKSRGREKAQPDSVERQLATVTRELDSVREQLRKANLILDVQKKVLSLCGDIAQSKQKAR